MTMFVPPRDEHNETWNGPRTGESGAKEVFGADEVSENGISIERTGEM